MISNGMPECQSEVRLQGAEGLTGADGLRDSDDVGNGVLLWFGEVADFDDVVARAGELPGPAGARARGDGLHEHSRVFWREEGLDRRRAPDGQGLTRQDS